MSNKDKGFASMDEDKVREIAHKGGEARKKQLGHEGYVELGHLGGEARSKNSSKSNHDYDDDRRGQSSRSNYDYDDDRRSQSSRSNYRHHSR